MLMISVNIEDIGNVIIVTIRHITNENITNDGYLNCCSQEKSESPNEYNIAIICKLMA